MTKRKAFKTEILRSDDVLFDGEPKLIVLEKFVPRTLQHKEKNQRYTTISLKIKSANKICNILRQVTTRKQNYQCNYVNGTFLYPVPLLFVLYVLFVFVLYSLREHFQTYSLV